MTLDTTKPLQTVEGTPVTLVLTEARGNYPLVGYIGDTSALQQWDEHGRGWTGDSYIVNVPETVTGWVNINKDRAGYPSREAADFYAREDRIACIKVTYTRGQFDD